MKKIVFGLVFFASLTVNCLAQDPQKETKSIELTTDELIQMLIDSGQLNPAQFQMYITLNGYKFLPHVVNPYKTTKLENLKSQLLSEKPFWKLLLNKGFNPHLVLGTLNRDLGLLEKSNNFSGQNRQIAKLEKQVHVLFARECMRFLRDQLFSKNARYYSQIIQEISQEHRLKLKSLGTSQDELDTMVFLAEYSPSRLN